MQLCRRRSGPGVPRAGIPREVHDGTSWHPFFDLSYIFYQLGVVDTWFSHFSMTPLSPVQDNTFFSTLFFLFSFFPFSSGSVSLGF